MTPDQFTEYLHAEGFGEPVIVEREPGGGLEEHTHPFEARALILDGEITLRIDGKQTRYATGQVFHLANGAEHAETYGPRGVRYLVGRK